VFRSVTVFERLARIIVVADEGTVAGTRQSLPLIEVTGLPVEIQGRAILFALSAFRNTMAQTSRYEKRPTPALHQLVGVKSWPKFDEVAKSVRVTQTESELALIPMRYEGPRGGSTRLDSKKIVVANTEEAIGAALSNALSLCE
jgi:hypothetical protein